MDSSADNFDLFPEERPDARHALLDLFPEESEALKDKRAQEVIDRVAPKLEEAIQGISDHVETEIQNIQEIVNERIDAIELTPGERGPRGDKGERGDRGPKGERGPMGFSGAKGEKGEKGDKGDKGEKGKDADIKDLEPEIKKLRIEMLSMGHGGNMNRNISIGGNSSVLSRYTDINLKAGANVTLSYANNDQTKNVDVTVAATGGSGTTRSINSISTSQTAGNTAGTDYVYICSAGINLTLPDAVGNTNLYTIKNTSTSSVLVTTTAAETIDGSANLILATRYTSVDLISDSANWDIT